MEVDRTKIIVWKLIYAAGSGACVWMGNGNPWLGAGLFFALLSLAA